MKKLNWNRIRLILMLIALVVVYAFSLSRNEKRMVSGPEVEFEGDSKLFLTDQMVNNLLIEKFNGAKSVRKEQLILKELEGVLAQNESIQEAEVYVTTDGKLKAKVKQKTPIARVLDGGSSFYIDYQGSKMPLSRNFSARVPLVSPAINPEKNLDIIQVLRYIYDDEFLQKNIVSIDANNPLDLVMLTRNFNYKIHFGKPENLHLKFSNYKAFYQKASQDTLIDTYNEVSLKFTNQVVCTKN